MALSEEALNVKNKLKTLESKKRLLKSIQQQIANARADMSGISAVSYENAKVVGGGKTSVQERFTALITKLEARYEKVMAEAFAIEDAIAEAVYYLDEVEQAMIIDRYVNGYSWRKIERLHNYCERQVFNIHAEALESMAKNECCQEHLKKF
jgi:DNA-directed RNA polymerase specialized sigma subunit